MGSTLKNELSRPPTALSRKASILPESNLQESSSNIEWGGNPGAVFIFKCRSRFCCGLWPVFPWGERARGRGGRRWIAKASGLSGGAGEVFSDADVICHITHHTAGSGMTASAMRCKVLHRFELDNTNIYVCLTESLRKPSCQLDEFRQILNMQMRYEKLQKMKRQQPVKDPINVNISSFRSVRRVASI